MSSTAEADDLGPALQVEDALTVMVVILVLRLVLFVPLMNLDRARLDHAEKETYWEQLYERLRSAPPDAAMAASYEDAFALGGKSARISAAGGGKLRFLEIADPDQNVTVIRHDLGGQGYRSLFIQKFSNVPSFRHGRIKWSPRERKWFTLDDQVDYAQTPESAAMLDEYREWAATREGGK